jgi:hypothetical protein
VSHCTTSSGAPAQGLGFATAITLSTRLITSTCDQAYAHKALRPAESLVALLLHLCLPRHLSSQWPLVPVAPAAVSAAAGRTVHSLPEYNGFRGRRLCAECVKLDSANLQFDQKCYALGFRLARVTESDC